MRQHAHHTGLTDQVIHLFLDLSEMRQGSWRLIEHESMQQHVTEDAAER
jgi:hypothetical protein